MNQNMQVVKIREEISAVTNDLKDLENERSETKLKLFWLEYNFSELDNRKNFQPRTVLSSETYLSPRMVMSTEWWKKLLPSWISRSLSLMMTSRKLSGKEIQMESLDQFLWNYLMKTKRWKSWSLKKNPRIMVMNNSGRWKSWTSNRKNRSCLRMP